MKARQLLVFFVGVAVVIASVVALAAYFSQKAPPDRSEISQLGGDFTLQADTGTVALQDFRGKVVLLFFGYTHCPDVCPTTMNNLGLAFSELSAQELAKVQGLFVTVDPERDSAAHLAEYVRFFHPNIKGLTGSLQQIKQVARAYEVEFLKESSDESYLMTHSSYLFVLDGNGKVVDMMGHNTPPAEIAAVIRKLI